MSDHDCQNYAESDEGLIYYCSRCGRKITKKKPAIDWDDMFEDTTPTNELGECIPIQEKDDRTMDEWLEDIVKSKKGRGHHRYSRG